MRDAKTNFYLQWRLNSPRDPHLGEDSVSPPEKLLQAIWRHQRLLRDQLTGSEGRPICILHPGFHNLEGGPDFGGAVVQFGDDKPVTGDIEVDVRPQGWVAHGHNRNPAFKKVILQVVWEASGASSLGPPILAIKSKLDAPLSELSLWLGSDGGPGFPEMLRGNCCAPLKKISLDRLIQLLNEAGVARLQAKAEIMQARARRAGWEQALWEGFFRGLGYKHNVWPMQRLGELRPVWGQKPADPVLLQARLLGLSGLLPHELDKSEPELKGYVRELWDHWWRERDKLAEYILPPSIWRFHGMRPSNHPQRRLAMATQLALSGTFVQRLEKWCVESIKPAKLPESLLEALNLQPDPFWSWHATFRSPRMKTSQPILGGTRITDLAINIILPWLWVRAGEGKNAKLQTSIQERFQAWPPAQDNSLLTRLSQLGVDFNYFAGGDR